MTSAKQSTGSISPVDGLAPKVIANSGTVRIANPCTPVFDMPTKRAIRNNTAHAHSPCMYAEKTIISYFFQAFTTSPMYIVCNPAGKLAY